MPSWPVAITLAVLSCWALLVPRMRRLGHRPAAVLIWVALALPVGALGAAGLEAILAWAAGTAPAGGYTALGAIVSCVAFTTWWAPRALGVGTFAALDPVAFTLPLCHGLGRIGCLLEGCCFGTPTQGAPAWATVASAAYAPGSAARSAYPDDVVLWNLPLLLGLLSLAVVGLAEVLWRRRESARLRVGTVTFATVAALCLARGVVDVVRGGPASAVDPWTATSVLLGGIALLALGLGAGRPRYG